MPLFTRGKDPKKANEKLLVEVVAECLNAVGRALPTPFERGYVSALVCGGQLATGLLCRTAVETRLSREAITSLLCVFTQSATSWWLAPGNTSPGNSEADPDSLDDHTFRLILATYKQLDDSTLREALFLHGQFLFEAENNRLIIGPYSAMISDKVSSIVQDEPIPLFFPIVSPVSTFRELIREKTRVDGVDYLPLSPTDIWGVPLVLRSQ